MGHQKQMRENVRMNCRQSGCRVWRKIADVEIRLVREMINMNELIILNMIVPVFQSPTPQPTSLKNLTPVLGLMSACLNVWRETRQRGGGVAAAETNITSLCCLEKLIHESNLKGQRGALGQVLSKQIGFMKMDGLFTFRLFKREMQIHVCTFGSLANFGRQKQRPTFDRPMLFILLLGKVLSCHAYVKHEDTKQNTMGR